MESAVVIYFVRSISINTINCRHHKSQNSMVNMPDNIRLGLSNRMMGKIAEATNNANVSALKKFKSGFSLDTDKDLLKI